MRDFHRFVLMVLLPLLPLGAAGNAYAQTEQELIDRGIQLRREGKDLEALAEFRRAIDLSPSARAQVQLGLAEQALARWVDAERDLQAGLGHADDAWVTKNRVEIERSLAVVREHLGTLVLDSPNADARVSVNGEATGSVGQEIRVPAGNVLVEIEATGHVTRRLTLSVAPQAVVREQVELVRATEPRPLALPILTSARTASAPCARTQPVPPPPVSRTDPRRVLAWVATASAGIFLSEAVVAHILRNQYASRYNDDELCSVQGRPRSEVCPKYLYQAEAAETAAGVGYALGGVAALGAVYLFWTSPDTTSQISMVGSQMTFRQRW